MNLIIQFYARGKLKKDVWKDATRFMRSLLVACVCFCVASCTKQKGKEIGESGLFLYKYPENGKFYILDQLSHSSGVGCIDGTVVSIGYNRTTVLVEVESIFVGSEGREPNQFYRYSIAEKKFDRITRKEYDIISSEIGIWQPSVTYNNL